MNNDFQSALYTLLRVCLHFSRKCFQKASKIHFQVYPDPEAGFIKVKMDGLEVQTQSADIYYHFWITVLINVVYNNKMYSVITKHNQVSWNKTNNSIRS